MHAIKNTLQFIFSNTESPLAEVKYVDEFSKQVEAIIQRNARGTDIIDIFQKCYGLLKEVKLNGQQKSIHICSYV